MLLCLVCLTLLASFFLPSHLSFKNMYIHDTNTISDTERGKGVTPGYRQLSRQRERERKRERGGGGGGGGEREGEREGGGEGEERGGERGGVVQCITALLSHMQGKSTDSCGWSMGIHKWL